MLLNSILNSYNPEGIRVVGTYQCKRNCSFCYQTHKISNVLCPIKFEVFLQELIKHKFYPTYFTFQGGEISDFVDESYEWFRLADKYYPQIFRKSITSNGHGDIEYYLKSKLLGISHITFSLHNDLHKSVEDKLVILKNDGFFTVRVNCYLNMDKLEDVKYVIDFCTENKIQLTLCEDLRLSSEIDYDSANILTQTGIIDSTYVIDRYRHQSILTSEHHNFRIWIYKHLNHYDYNNIIVKPDGTLTMTFDDIINSL